VEGSCECGNEPSDSVKRWEVPEWLHNWQLLKKGSATRESEWVEGYININVWRFRSYRWQVESCLLHWCTAWTVYRLTFSAVSRECFDPCTRSQLALLLSDYWRTESKTTPIAEGDEATSWCKFFFQLLTLKYHYIYLNDAMHDSYCCATRPFTVTAYVVRLCSVLPWKVKVKAIPVTGCGGPQDCETSRLQHFLDSRLTDGGEVVSLTRQPSVTPGKIPGTHFC
jgi:hypothetical protein